LATPFIAFFSYMFMNATDNDQTNEAIAEAFISGMPLKASSAVIGFLLVFVSLTMTGLLANLYVTFKAAASESKNLPETNV
jgi:hypothetical protein